MFFLLTRPVALLIKTLFLLAKAKKTSKAYFPAKKAFFALQGKGEILSNKNLTK